MKNSNKDILKGNLLKNIVIFAIPVILSSVMQLLFNACDLMVVGKFAGDDSLAAVGSTTSLISLMINFFIGLSVGANVVVAKYIGSKNHDKCQDAVHTSILLSVVVGTFLSIFGFFASKFLLTRMNTPQEIIDKASLYLKIYFLGAIFNLTYNFGAAILRSTGETKKPLYYLFIAGAINATLNLFFIAVLKMDVAGVALATVISQFISCFLVVRCIMKTDGYINLNLRKIKMKWESLYEILIVGLPAGIQSSLFAISNVSIQKAVNSFNSTAVVAGNSASSNLGSFIYSSMNAFYHSCLTFTSQAIGAKDTKICKKILRYNLICVVTVGLFLGSLFTLLGKELLGLYTSEAESIKYGYERLRLVAITYFLCGMAEVLTGALRGLGYSMAPMAASIFCICFFRILWIKTAFEANKTITVLYAAYPLSWTLAIIAHLTCFIILFKIVKSKMASANYEIDTVTSR